MFIDRHALAIMMGRAGTAAAARDGRSFSSCRE